jgi:protein transport protein SEC24
MLPLYMLGLTKSAAFRGSQRDVGVDERVAVAFNIQGASVADILRLAYPSLYALHDPQRAVAGNWGTRNEEGQLILPAGVAAESSQLNADGAYLLDNGRLFLLWLGHSISRDFVAQIFGLAPEALPHDVERLPLEPAQGSSDVSRRFNALLEGLRAGRATHGQVFVVRQGSALEGRVAPYLVEDGSPGGPAYQDWLLQCHKAVLTGK